MSIRVEDGITILTPSEGMYLYDGETIADYEVYLGKFDSPDNWKEITEKEKEEIEEKQNEQN